MTPDQPRPRPGGQLTRDREEPAEERTGILGVATVGEVGVGCSEALAPTG